MSFIVNAGRLPQHRRVIFEGSDQARQKAPHAPLQVSCREPNPAAAWHQPRDTFAQSLLHKRSLCTCLHKLAADVAHQEPLPPVARGPRLVVAHALNSEEAPPVQPGNAHLQKGAPFCPLLAELDGFVLVLRESKVSENHRKEQLMLLSVARDLQ